MRQTVPARCFSAPEDRSNCGRSRSSRARLSLIGASLLGGAALVSASASADEFEALKKQIEALDSRIAAMEAVPLIATGHSMLSVWAGPRVETPGLPMAAGEVAAFGDTASYVSVLPVADAPASSIITWSGYARAGAVYSDVRTDLKIREVNSDDTVGNLSLSDDTPDTDVKARGQIRVTATTDTAVGEVGVDLRLRADFDGNGFGSVYSNLVWGYWSMTPELTFGGGYAGSLGNVAYGYDGACTCYFTDNADVGFNPGDTTQFRLSYESGALAAAIAFEDASFNTDEREGRFRGVDSDGLGVAGAVIYTGRAVNGEIAAVWRGVDGRLYPYTDDLWQIGAGLGLALGDIARLSLATAYGAGPWQNVASNASNYAGEISQSYPYQNRWWGVTGLVSVTITEKVYAELAAGYKEREGVDADDGVVASKDIHGSTSAIMGGVYYDLVPQLTVGVEAEYYVNPLSVKLRCISEERCDDSDPGDEVWNDQTTDSLTLDFVSVWSF